LITTEKAKVVSEIVLTADRVESEKLKGSEFKKAVMQYCASLNISADDLDEIMDTKLREIIARD